MTPIPSGLLPALRRFAATLVAASPRLVGEGIVVAVIAGLIEGFSTLLLVPLLQLVGVDVTQGSLSGIVSRFRDAFGFFGVQPTLPIVLMVYVAAVVAQSAVQRRQSTIGAALQHQLTERLRERVYRAVASAKWVHFARNKSAGYAHVLTNEIDRAGFIAGYLVDFAATAAVALAYIVLAFRVSPSMAVLVLGSGLILAVLAKPLIEKAHASGRQWTDAWRDLHTAIIEHLGSMKIAKAYGVGQRHAELFGRLSGDLGDIQVASVNNRALVRQLFAVGPAVILAVIVWVAYDLLSLPAASLLLMLFLFGRLVPRMTSLYEKAQLMAAELPVFERVMEIERSCLEAAEIPAATDRHVALKDRVAFEHVSFAYDVSNPSPTLHDINLVIPARATTAIVGSSGSGKSTIADVLMGLLEPAAGRVLVDGIRLGPETLSSWRDQIGYVPQDAFLFHDTILANLLWARPGATVADVWRALELAAADEFVRRLPKGLDAVIGDRGILISGGERQRLSLARALLREPRLLILDEATSSLDSENERRIQEAIENLHEHVTIVIITHRLSTVRAADVIHVVEQGKMVDSGRWDVLIGRSGRFRDLCRAQGIDVEPVVRA